jgi:hypothetical protein
MIVSVVAVLRLATSFSLHVMQVSIDVRVAFFLSQFSCRSVRSCGDGLIPIWRYPCFVSLLELKVHIEWRACGVITLLGEHASDAKGVTR